MWPHASHALFSSLLLLGIVFPIAAHSAKHGVRVSYDGRLSASGTQRALIRKDGEFRESEDPDPEDEPAEPAEPVLWSKHGTHEGFWTMGSHQSLLMD